MRIVLLMVTVGVLLAMTPDDSVGDCIGANTGGNDCVACACEPYRS